jgi:REP element-mobilizing transposase RayT
MLLQLQQELESLPDDKAAVERRIRIESMLDRGHGAMHLADPRIADTVERALLHFDGERYRLHAWVIMPNHVHVVATPLGDWTLARIMHSWKSFAAKEANRILGQSGAFWAREYHDRLIRDDVHFANTVSYVANNPVKAGLCKRAEDWRFSSASRFHNAESGSPGSTGF